MDTAISFGFVTDEVFRTSLENDYRELCACLKAEAWKMAHVAAGSIVEALLIDWLMVNGISRHKGKDHLRMDLGDALDACIDQKLISPRAKDLSSVIRGYRNLVHPCVVIRQREVIDQEGAGVAKSLVDMIVREIAAKRREQHGYTAEQVTDKVINDPACIPIVSHLLVKVRDDEKERMVLKVIPQRFAALIENAFVEELNLPEVLDALEALYHKVFAQLPDKGKEKAVAQYATILRTGSTDDRRWYEQRFFRASAIAYCCPEDAALILDHLHAMLSSREKSLAVYSGIGAFLTVSNCYLWINSFVEALVSRRNQQADEIIDLLHHELHTNMAGDVASEVKQHLEAFLPSNATASNSSLARQIERILDEHPIPF